MHGGGGRCWGNSTPPKDISRGRVSRGATVNAKD